MIWVIDRLTWSHDAEHTVTNLDVIVIEQDNDNARVLDT